MGQGRPEKMEILGCSLHWLALSNRPWCPLSRKSDKAAAVLGRSILPPAWRWDLLREDILGTSEFSAGQELHPCTGLAGMQPLVISRAERVLVWGRMHWFQTLALLSLPWSVLCAYLKYQSKVFLHPVLVRLPDRQICFSCVNPRTLAINLGISTWSRKNV